MVIYLCDGCGEKIEASLRGDWKSGALPRNVSLGLIVPVPIVLGNERGREARPVELCPTCLDSLEAWWKGHRKNT